MDALADPRAFLSQAEKRAKQMQDMGIDENDISDVPTTATKKQQKNKGQDNNTSATTGNNAKAPNTPAANKANSTDGGGANNAQKKDVKGEAGLGFELGLEVNARLS